MDVPTGVRQEEGHTGLLMHLFSAVLALTFLARGIQPFLSLVDREVDFCEEKSQLPGFKLTSQDVRRFRGYQLNHRGDRLKVWEGLHKSNQIEPKEKRAKQN